MIIQVLVDYGCKDRSLYFQQQEYQLAINIFTKILYLSNDTILKCYIYRGECYLHLCDFKNAINDYQSAFQLSQRRSKSIVSRYGYCYYMQGQVYLRHHQYHDALVAFNEAHGIDQSNLQYQIYRIRTLIALEDYETGLQILEPLLSNYKTSTSTQSLNLTMLKKPIDTVEYTTFKIIKQDFRRKRRKFG